LSYPKIIDFITIKTRKMGKLIVYNFLTANGNFKGAREDVSWAKNNSPEEMAFAAENLTSGNTLLLGRVTYQMMAGYWPTKEAIKQNPQVAEGMNKAEKIVFSRTLNKVEWNNTRIEKGDIQQEVKKLKQASGKDLTVLGSGSIVNQMAEKGLVDEFQLMIHPVIVGGGTQILKDIPSHLELKLVNTRTFKSGVIVLFYQTK
jgi:dihydrofolate reductase